MNKEKECRLTKAIDKISSLDKSIFDLQACLKKAKQLLNSEPKDDIIEESRDQ